MNNIQSLSNLNNKMYGCIKKPDSKSSNTSTVLHPLNFTLPDSYKPLSIAFNGTSNYATNIRLNNEFDRVFADNNATSFLNYINSTMKSLSSRQTLYFNWNTELSQTPECCKIKANKRGFSNEANVITVDKNAHVQIENSTLGNIFITPEELEEKCGMTDDNKFIIGNGVRFLDPADQFNWNSLPVGREWPPDENSIKGLLNLNTDKSKQAILFDSTDTDVGKNYNTKSRGLIAVNPLDSSVIVAVQQQNLNQDVNLAPWAIAPFKVPEGKKALTVFPVETPFFKKYDEDFSAYMQGKKLAHREIQDVILHGKDQWQVDRDNKFMMLDPSKDAGMVGALDSQATWSLFAVEDSDKVIVMRSIYRNSHGDQFKAFSLSGNAKYIEQELTAPRVKAGEKSTLVFKIDLVPLKDLDGVNFDKFSAKNFKDEVTQVANAVKSSITRIKRDTRDQLK